MLTKYATVINNVCIYIVHVYNWAKILSKNAKVEMEKMKYCTKEDNK